MLVEVVFLLVEVVFMLVEVWRLYYVCFNIVFDNSVWHWGRNKSDSAPRGIPAPNKLCEGIKSLCLSLSVCLCLSLYLLFFFFFFFKVKDVLNSIYRFSVVVLADLVRATTTTTATA